MWSKLPKLSRIEQKFAPAHSKFEFTTFKSPTVGKNAVVTNLVDFGGFGITAATLGTAASEPLAVVCAALRQIAPTPWKGCGVTRVDQVGSADRQSCLRVASAL
jgi:hypothetical protein